MIQQDLEIVGIDQPVLGRAAEKVVGVLRHKLIERSTRGHEYRRRGPIAPPRAARALPGGSDGARVGSEHGDVERADVNAELERVRRDHAQQAPLAQIALDGAPLERQVTATIPAYSLRDSGRSRKILPQVSHQDFRGQARIRKDDGLESPAHERPRDAARLVHVRAADAELRVDHRRIVEDEKLFGRGRAVFLDLSHRLSGQPRRELRRIGDGRRGRNELRPGAVKRRDALQPTKHVRQVRAEDAAVGVQLVQYHVAEVFEQPFPARVVGKDAGVQHIGVGQNQVRAIADGGTSIGGRVAVVSERPQRLAQLFRPAVELRQLVLCQGFGGEEVHGPRFRVLNERVQNRQVVAKRLPGSRGRNHHQVPALARQTKRLRLVGVELLDAAAFEDFGEVGRKAFGERGVLCVAGRDTLHLCHPAAGRRGFELRLNFRQRPFNPSCPFGDQMCQRIDLCRHFASLNEPGVRCQVTGVRHQVPGVRCRLSVDRAFKLLVSPASIRPSSAVCFRTLSIPA